MEFITKKRKKRKITEKGKERKKYNKLYDVFDAMKSRCYNKKNKRYASYGGKGVKICDEWLNNRKSFIMWALSHGYKSGLGMDRIDNDGDYTPSNCRFVNSRISNRNRSNTIYIVYQNKIHFIPDIAKEIGYSKQKIYHLHKNKGHDAVVRKIKEVLGEKKLKGGINVGSFLK